MTLDLTARARRLEQLFFSPLSDAEANGARDAWAELDLDLAIGRASGVTDPAALAVLREAGITPATAVAFTLIPLIEVAWADDAIQPRERDAILTAAHERGISDGSPGARVLDAWLTTRPAPALLAAWTEYVSALDERMSAAQRTRLMMIIVERAREIARAAGGILGIASISTRETEALTRLASAFKFPEQFEELFP